MIQPGCKYGQHADTMRMLLRKGFLPNPNMLYVLLGIIGICLLTPKQITTKSPPCRATAHSGANLTMKDVTRFRFRDDERGSQTLTLPFALHRFDHRRLTRDLYFPTLDEGGGSTTRQIQQRLGGRPRRRLRHAGKRQQRPTERQVGRNGEQHHPDRARARGRE